MKSRHLLLGAGLLLTGWLALLGDRTPADSADVVEPVTRSGAPVATNAAAARRPAAAAVEAEILAIAPRPAPGDDIIVPPTAPLFASQSWAPPPPKIVPPPPPPPAPPPTAPPLPFTYVGKQISDGQWSVFLARGDTTFIATAGAVLDNRYRVDSVAPPIMTLTYLPLKQVQQLSIGVHN